MNWIKHIVIGLVFGLTVFFFVTHDLLESVFFSLFAAGSSLLPDLDLAGSKARGLLDKLMIFIAAAATYVSYCGGLSCALSEAFLLRTFAFAGVYFVAFAYFGPQHRGITHSLFAAVLFSAILFFVIGWKFALAGGLGYVSHLLADWEIKFI